MSDIHALDDGEYTVVVDRVTDGLATVFFEQDGDVVSTAVFESVLLPAKAHHAGAILSLSISDDTVTLEYDADETERRADAAQDRFDDLTTDQGDGDD